MLRYLPAVLVALLAACSSTQLDQAPVSDRAATAPPGASGPQSRVAPVATQPVPSQAAGPVATPRIVYFAFDSAQIRPEFQSMIDAHARYLRANGGRKIVIEGHTDERGGREFNLALGQQRSQAVARALTLLGVAPAQIESISFGEEKPAEAGSEEAAWSKNRRAEIAYR